MSDDAEHFYDLRQVKLKRLRALDKQAALLGDAQTPAHIQVERAELRAELGLVEGIIGLAMRPQIGDELSANGRFLAYIVEIKRANDGIAQLGEKLEGVFEQVNRFRQWIILIGIVVVVILVAGAVVATYVFTRGGT